MYQTILLCYDGSVEGRNALKEGAEVALAMHAQAYLLAIIRETVGLLIPGAMTETMLRYEDDMAHQVLEEGVQWLRERGLEAHGRIVFGDPIAHIARSAHSVHADLIVLGHRHRSRMARWWSDAEDATLLEQAPCSILVTVAREGPVS